MNQLQDLTKQISEKNQKNLKTLEPDPKLTAIKKTSQVLASSRKSTTWGGAMDSIFLFILCELSSQIKPGDKVLDLGCGTADFLLKAAALHPQADFTGADSSDESLHIAKNRADSLGITNVNFVKTDITKLESLPAESFDVVISILNSQLISDKVILQKFHKNIENFVKKEGSILIVDSTRSQSNKFIQMFTKTLYTQAPACSVKNITNSIQSTFSKADFLASCSKLTLKLEHRSTYLADFLIVLRTPPKVPFFKRRAIWHIPLYKMTLKSWYHYTVLKLLWTKKSIN